MAVNKQIFALLSFLLFQHAFGTEIDENGYVMYCPCMGKFCSTKLKYTNSIRWTL